MKGLWRKEGRVLFRRSVRSLVVCSQFALFGGKTVNNSSRSQKKINCCGQEK